MLCCSHACSIRTSDGIRKLSRREYDKLVDLGVFEDERVELLRGMLVTMSGQGGPHSAITSWLAQRLTRLLDESFDVRAHSSYAATEDSEPKPDISVSRRAPGNFAHPDAALLLIDRGLRVIDQQGSTAQGADLRRVARPRILDRRHLEPGAPRARAHASDERRRSTDRDAARSSDRRSSARSRSASLTFRGLAERSHVGRAHRCEHRLRANRLNAGLRANRLNAETCFRAATSSARRSSLRPVSGRRRPPPDEARRDRDRRR